MSIRLPLRIKILPTFILAGDSLKRRTEWLETLKNEIESQDGRAPLISRLTGFESLEDVTSRLQTPPLFGGRALLIIDEGEIFLRNYDDWLIKRLNRGGRGILILILNELERRSLLYRTAVKKGALVDVSQPSGGALLPALREYAARLELRIDTSALRLLLSYTKDFDSAASEIEKLALLDKSRISVSDVEELVVDTAESSEYALSNAIERLDLADAMDTVARAWRNGVRLMRANRTLTDPGDIALYFMNQLLLSLLRLRTVCHLKRSGRGDDEVARVLRLTDWAKQNILPQIKRTALKLGKRIDTAIRRLSDCDAAIKSGADPRLQLESFLCQLILPSAIKKMDSRMNR